MGRGIEEGAEKLWMTGYVYTSIGTWMERLIYLLTDRSLYIYIYIYGWMDREVTGDRECK